jgi:hypothetical protein
LNRFDTIIHYITLSERTKKHGKTKVSVLGKIWVLCCLAGINASPRAMTGKWRKRYGQSKLIKTDIQIFVFTGLHVE